MTFWKWVAGAFEDGTGKLSHKRIGFYFSLFMVYRFGTEALKTGKAVDINVLILVGALCLGLAGLSVTEWFTIAKKKNEDSG